MNNKMCYLNIKDQNQTYVRYTYQQMTPFEIKQVISSAVSNPQNDRNSNKTDATTAPTITNELLNKHNQDSKPLSRTNPFTKKKQTYLDKIIESEQRRLGSDNTYFIDDHYTKIQFTNKNLICSSAHFDDPRCESLFFDATKYADVFDVAKIESEATNTMNEFYFNHINTNNDQSNSKLNTVLSEQIQHENKDGKGSGNRQSSVSNEDKQDNHDDDSLVKGQFVEEDDVKYIETELDETSINRDLIQNNKLLKRKLRMQIKRYRMAQISQHIDLWFF